SAAVLGRSIDGGRLTIRRLFSSRHKREPTGDARGRIFSAELSRSQRVTATQFEAFATRSRRGDKTGSRCCADYLVAPLARAVGCHMAGGVSAVCGGVSVALLSWRATLGTRGRL